MTDLTIDPQAQALLDHVAGEMAKAPKPSHELTEAERVAKTRQGYLSTIPLAGEPESVWKVEDLDVPGQGGPVRARLFWPTRSMGPGPVLLWFHGGGFVSGDLETHDRPLRALANRLQFPLLAVAWRLAPEHPYPAGLEDAMCALRWAGGQPWAGTGRIAIGGDSAGGNVAAVLAHRARDGAGPQPAFQVLLYPNTDLEGDGSAYPSWAENDGRILTRSDMRKNFRLYAGRNDRADPGLSPLRAADLARLPPALIVTAEADPQRDEGEAYAAKLRQAGVEVEHIRYPGMIHGFFQMGGMLDAGRDVIHRIGTSLNAALAKGR